MKRLAALLFLCVALTAGEASAVCFGDNISGVYNMDWTSPDGTGHSSTVNAMTIQLHQTCGWVPRGSLTGTMRWFADDAPVYLIQSTSWNYSYALWYVHELSQDNWFQFNCNYVRPSLWHCAMNRYDVPTSSWVGNGAVDIYK